MFVGKDGMRSGLFLVLLLMCSHMRGQQDGALDLVQAVVDGLRSPQQAHEAALLIQEHTGIAVCRVDHNTRNLMLQVGPGIALNASMLDQWLTGLQLHVRCYRRIPHATGPFHHLDPRHCGLDPADR
ncbi:MAG: hypothetical protein H6597_00430 [Flavobacteriales bacterium]|nr:hypothetical protein [Flavobacteriales bacterium]MCB9192970.1 hypothetical protein [Flavobacteriales bacterium]